MTVMDTTSNDKWIQLKIESFDMPIAGMQDIHSTWTESGQIINERPKYHLYLRNKGR